MGPRNRRQMNEVFIIITSIYSSVLVLFISFQIEAFLMRRGIRKEGQGNQNTERKILLSSVAAFSSLKCLRSNILLLLNLINSLLVLIKISFLSTLKATGKIHRSVYYHCKRNSFFLNHLELYQQCRQQMDSCF